VSRVDELAEEIVARVLAESGFVGKSAGAVAASRAQIMPHALAVVGGIALVEDQLKAIGRQVKRNGKRLQRMVDANGERIRQLTSDHQVPGVAEVGQRVVDLDMHRFRVGLIDMQAPKAANGHGGFGEGVSPSPAPEWHPEHPEGGL